MTLVDLLSGVCDQLRDGLVELAEDLPCEGLNAKLFRDLISRVETCLDTAGLSVLEAFVESQEETRDVIEHEGRKHRFKEVTEKEWLTPFGLARVSRRYFQPDAGGDGVVPIDLRCGMKDRYMTPDLEEACALGSAMLVPREVETFLKKLLPVAPSATAIQKVIRQVGDFAEEHQDRIEEEMSEKAPLKPTGEVLVVSWDGVTVPLREKGKKQGRPKERPGGEQPKESATAWREAGVGTVSIYERDLYEQRAVRKDTRYFARMPETGMKSLVQRLEGTVAELRAERSFEEVVVLCDGKPSIWNAATKAECYEGATFILDFFHAAEQLSKASETIFGKNSDKAKKWYAEYRARLKEDPDGVVALIRSLRYYTNKIRRGSQRRKTLRRAIGYFGRNSNRMRYAEFLERGLPIGSGPVEAACKTVVGARLKRSGMRWNRDGGQRVLNLRVHHLSKRWEVFWETYMTQRMAA